MHIAFAGGGTAGHVTPALSIADAILRRSPNTKITFFTSPSGVEKGILEGYPYHTVELPIHNLSRSLSWKTARTVVEVPLAIRRARQYLRNAQVDMVIATGGYVAYPAMIAAQRERLPNYIHESNSVAGLVTRVTAKRATAIFTNFEECKDQFSPQSNTHFVGNFILTNKGVESKKALRKRLCLGEADTLVLVMGGSLGARKINETVIQLVKKHKRACSTLHFVISTGKKNHMDAVEQLKVEFGSLPQNIHLFPYISPMSDYWQAADIAITRAGACTLSELCYYRVPAIVIPFPTSAKNHQKYNAIAYEKAGCGLLLEENELDADSLFNKLDFLLKSPLQRQAIYCHQAQAFPVNCFTQMFSIIGI